MTAAKRIELISVDQYLAGELVSDVRHEYLAGRVYAMAGGLTVHNRVATNLLIAVGRRLEGKPCEAFNSDMKFASGFRRTPDSTTPMEWWFAIQPPRTHRFKTIPW